MLVDESKLHLTPVTLGSGSDCDDKTWVMMGKVIEQQPRSLFGFTEGYNRGGEKHAWCFMMTKGETLKYVEPATAAIFLPTVEKIYHFIR